MSPVYKFGIVTVKNRNEQNIGVVRLETERDTEIGVYKNISGVSMT